MNKQGKRVVLIGSAGTGTAFAAATALRRVWSQSVCIVAIDINPWHLFTTSLLADEYEHVPFSNSETFPTVLQEIIQRYAVDTYMPLLPDEMLLAAQLRDQSLIPTEVSVLAPPTESCAACADKWTLNQLLAEHGVPVPRSSSASDPFAGKDFFLKPKNGTGSYGARKVKADELASIVGNSAEEWVIQEICTGPEVTVDAFYDKSSNFIRAVCRERIEIKSGVSTKCRLFIDKDLCRYALSVATILDLTGSFCFQVMRNTSGWVVIDVNPRPGGGTAMCALVGNDFFAATFAQIWGEDTIRFFREFEGDHFVTRQYAEFLMSPSS